MHTDGGISTGSGDYTEGLVRILELFRILREGRLKEMERGPGAEPSPHE